MKIAEAMNKNACTIRTGTTMAEAARMLSRSMCSDLMVVDDEGSFVGVFSEGDLVRAVMPRFEDLMLSSGTLYETFGLFLEQGHEVASHPIDELVIRNAVTVSSTDEAVKAAATMVSKQIRCLPVVDDGELVGTISRADIAVAVIGG